MATHESLPAPWASVRDRFRERGLRWTPQRRTLIEVLAHTRGHVTGTALIEQCRAMDPTTIPSTVYRTLDLLEELGLVRHGHGASGREEYHVGPEAAHGHLYCAECGRSWEVTAEEGAALADGFRVAHGFEVDLSHVTIVGRCRSCAQAATG